MKNNRKYWLIALVLALAIMVSLVAIGCDEDPNSGTSGTSGTAGNGSVETIAPPADGLDKGEFKITVKYSLDGSIAEGVEVLLYVLDLDDTPYSGATTGNDGVAILKAAVGLEYMVRLDRVPEGYVYDEVYLSETTNTATVYLEDSNATNQYTVKIISEGGLPLSGLNIKLMDGSTALGTKTTDANGSVNFKVSVMGVYDIVIDALPAGYSFASDASFKTSASENLNKYVVKSSVIKEKMPANYRYEMDDIMYDFTVQGDTGETITLSEILKTKKLVMINFWYANCGPCRAEFEGMQMAYEKYEKDMAIIALNTTDNLNRIARFRSEYSPALTFYMAMDSENLFGGGFATQAHGATPTSIFIDRYGKVCNYVTGSATQAYFEQQFAIYTDENYTQAPYTDDDSGMIEDTVAKPNVTMDASESIVNAISSIGGTFREVGDGEIWPWVLTKDGNEDVLSVSNIRLRNTSAAVMYDFKIAEGKFLTFDYKTNTEDVGGADILTAYIDEMEVTILDRVTDGEWTTCVIYTPMSSTIDDQDASRTHTLMLIYAKDSSDSWLQGTEVVSIKNIRTVGQEDLSGDVNIMRNAAWDYNENAEDGTSPWNQFASVVFNESDGYYHVGTQDGPLLLANIGGTTRYSGRSQYSLNELSSYGYFKMFNVDSSYGKFIVGVDNPPEDSYIESDKGYAWLAINSSMPNYCPVDERLMIVLDGLAKGFYQNKYQGNSLVNYYNDNTWLEFCVYYDNYCGDEIVNPIIGICNKAAIPVEAGTKDNPIANRVVVDRTLVPRGIIHSFTPVESGVYRVYSIIPEEYASKQGGYCYVMDKDGNYRDDDNIGNFDMYFTGIAGETYYIGVAFDSPDSLGELDFYIEHVSQYLDNFTYCSDGSLYWVLDEDGNPIYDENGEICTELSRHNNIQVALGSDNVYHQVLPDGSIDMGENSEIWLSVATANFLFSEDMTLESYLAVKGNENAFDFRPETGETVDTDDQYTEDYTEYIKGIIKESKNNKGELYGMVKADKKLVDIITKFIKRNSGEREDDNVWLVMAYYYEHLGVK